MSSVAFGNGAMGLALEMFEYRTWAVYVVAMVVLEAWLIGIRGGYDWPRSLLISFLANGITAFMCPAIIAVGLHGFNINPNPLLYVTKLLFFFGIGSAYMESIAWSLAKPTEVLAVPDNRFAQFYQKSIVLRSFAAHMIGIPLALVILLSPSHPYQGLTRIVEAHRSREMRQVIMSLEEEIREKGQVPSISSIEDLVDKYAPTSIKNEADLWAIGYIPDYTRFDTGEQRRKPWEWNPNASGKTTATDETGNRKLGAIWLSRTQTDGYFRGYILDRDSGQVKS